MGKEISFVPPFTELQTLQGFIVIMVVTTYDIVQYWSHQVLHTTTHTATHHRQHILVLEGIVRLVKKQIQVAKEDLIQLGN